MHTIDVVHKVFASAAITDFAVFVTLLTAVCAVGGFMWRAYFRDLVIRSETARAGLTVDIERLHNDKHKLAIEVDRLKADLAQANADHVEHADALKGRVPSEVMIRARKLRSQEGLDEAKKLSADWLHLEGPALSELLLLQAEWAQRLAGAAGIRSAALSVADSYAQAAACVDPSPHTISFAVETAQWIAFEAHPRVAIASARKILDEGAAEAKQFLAKDVERALDGMAEAEKLFRLGSYNAALSAVDLSISSLSEQLGSDARQTLAARSIRIGVLTRLGNIQEAFGSYPETLSAQINNRSIGPTDPDTLRTLIRGAELTFRQGDDSKARRMLEDVVSARPLHADTCDGLTLDAHLGLASCLSLTGETELAIEKAARVAERWTALYGQESVEAINGELVVATSMVRTQRYADALTVCDHGLNACDKSADIGHDHPLAIELIGLRAFCLLFTDGPARAEPELIKGYNLAAHRYGETSPHTVQFHELLEELRTMKSISGGVSQNEKRSGICSMTFTVNSPIEAAKKQYEDRRQFKYIRRIALWSGCRQRST